MDISRLKSRLNNLQSNGSQTSNLWKPAPGKQIVRIVPNKFDKNMPFMETYFHYGINGKSILSPKSFEEKDPIEEFSTKLQLSGNRDDYRLGKKLSPKMRTYVPIIVRGEETEGVRYWGFGKMVYQELLSIMCDEDYGDITDIVSGRDILVEFTTAEENGTQFPKTSVRIKPNQSSLFDDGKIIKKWIGEQKPLKEIFKSYSYDEMKEILNSWLNQVPTEEQEEPKIINTLSVTAEDVFDDLFSD
jgi:hypothetical protein